MNSIIRNMVSVTMLSLVCLAPADAFGAFHASRTVIRQRTVIRTRAVAGGPIRRLPANRCWGGRCFKPRMNRARCRPCGVVFRGCGGRRCF